MYHTKKLFKLIIDKDIKKKDLEEMASIGNSTMAKLGNTENVTIEGWLMNCTLDDIVEIIPDYDGGRFK